MQRFLDESESEQYAVFSSPVTGKLSISKACTCAENLHLDGGVDSAVEGGEFIQSRVHNGE
jgi:hypothetical protein